MKSLMRQASFWGLMALLWIVLYAQVGDANTLTDDGFVGSGFIAKLVNAVWTVWLPAMLTAGVLFVLWQVKQGRELGRAVTWVVLIGLVVAGGIPYLGQQLGVNLAFGTERTRTAVVLMDGLSTINGDVGVAPVVIRLTHPLHDHWHDVLVMPPGTILHGYLTD